MHREFPGNLSETWDNLNSVSLEGRRWPPLKLEVKRSD
jgi:hypothetical protein